MQWSNWIQNRERSEMNSYIKGSLMLELSCTLSINDYGRNTGPNSLHAGSFKFRSKPERSSPPWNQWSYGSVPIVVLHVSENAVFSTASWIQLSAPSLFFFLSAHTLLWRDSSLCFSPLQAFRLSYRWCMWELQMTVSAIYYTVLPNWSFQCKRWKPNWEIRCCKVYCNWTSLP